MVSERLEQVFNIQGQRSNVAIRLRNIMLMEQARQRGKAQDYDLIYGKDLNTEYQITLQRNPCLGLDADLKRAQNNLTNIRQSYTIFYKKYAGGEVSNQDEMNAFHDLQQTLVAKYPKVAEPSACPDIQAARDKYNELVDSILSVSVSVKASASDALDAIGGAEAHVLNAKSILANTHLLDNTISRRLVSRDETERSDLDEQCRTIIRETSAMIGSRLGQTAEERNAIKLFRKAVQYYKKTCK